MRKTQMSATTYVYISFIINIEFSAYKTDNNIKKHILLSNENHLYKIYNCWCWLYNHFVWIPTWEILYFINKEHYQYKRRFLLQNWTKMKYRIVFNTFASFWLYSSKVIIERYSFMSCLSILNIFKKIFFYFNREFYYYFKLFIQIVYGLLNQND